MYNEGISKEGELVDLGVACGVVDKSGAWYSYNKDRIGQGKDNARQFLKEHPEIADEIESRIRDKLDIGKTATQESEPTPAEEVEA